MSDPSTGPDPAEGVDREPVDLTDDGAIDSDLLDAVAADLGLDPEVSGGRADGDASGEKDLVEAVAVAEAIAKERDEYLNLAKRVQADFENYKRRVEAQAQEQRQRAAEGLAQDLLPVLDACEAAESHGSEDVVAIHAQIYSTMEKKGLERVADHGVAFDPNIHEAVLHEDGDSDAPIVSEVMRTGYLWNGRVLRPAMVKVKG